MAGRAVKVPRHATTWPGNARTCTPRARRPTAPSMAAVQLEPTCRPQRFLSTEQHELAEVSVRKLSAVAVGLQEGSNKQAGGLVVHRVGQVQPGGSCQRNFWPALSAPAPRWRHAAASAGTPTHRRSNSPKNVRDGTSVHLCNPAHCLRGKIVSSARRVAQTHRCAISDIFGSSVCWRALPACRKPKSRPLEAVNQGEEAKTAHSTPAKSPECWVVRGGEPTVRSARHAPRRRPPLS